MRGQTLSTSLLAACAALWTGCGGGGTPGVALLSPPPVPPAQTPTFMLLSPNGGETWTASFRATIAWEVGTHAGPVDIDLSRDGGATWQALVSITENDGSASVVVPTLVGTTVRVRVGAADGDPATPGSYSDESDADFSIQAPFREVKHALGAASLGAVAWGDYDGDGDLDLARSGGTALGWITRLHRNDGGGTFEDIGVALAGAVWGALAWGDYDGDGDLDLFTMGLDNAGGGVSHLYRNDGEGTFAEVPTTISVLRFGSADWGDLDTDGDLDLVTCGSGQTYVYRNDGAGVFSPVGIGMAGVQHGKAALGDFDADGDLDLAMAGDGATPEARLYRNDGAWAFTEVAAGLVGVTNAAVAWADHDLDGDLDLTLMGLGGDGQPTTRIYRNDGRAKFTDIAAGLAGMEAGALAWGDYDGDGDPDLALIGRAGPFPTSRVYRNDGGGAFTDTQVAVQGDADGSLAWVDYDGDGDLDLASSTVMTVHVHENVGGAPNSPPTAPTGVTVLAGGPTTAIAWDPAGDLESPAAALSYNLRIGTTPDTDDVAPGQALASGQRLLAEPGAIQPHASLAFAELHLAPGLYFASVQAVDPGFSASAWSDPVPFVVE